MDILAITKIGLGTFMGLAIGVLLRFVLIKVLIIVGIPVAILFFFDYAGFYKVNWLLLNEGWQMYVIPPVIDVFNYFNQHMLLGIIPGIIIGFSMGFILTKRLV